MGSWFSGDHIAGDRMHTDITTCNVEEPQRRATLERSVIDELKHVLLDPNKFYCGIETQLSSVCSSGLFLPLHASAI